jgi:hypothetical protein
MAGKSEKERRRLQDNGCYKGVGSARHQLSGDQPVRDADRGQLEEREMVDQRQRLIGSMVAIAAVGAWLAVAPPAVAQIIPQGPPGSPISWPQLAGRSFWLQGPGRCLTITSQGPDGSFLGQLANYRFYPMGMAEPRIAERIIRAPADRIGTVEPGFGRRVIQSWTGSDPVRGQISPLWGASYLIVFSVEPLVTAAAPARRVSYQGRFYYSWTTGTMGSITGDYVEETKNLFMGPFAPWQPVGPPQRFTGWPQAY